jgi:hypothetical protein
MTKSLAALCVVVMILPMQAQDTKAPNHNLWALLKKALLDTEGLDYFEKNIKGALLPPLAGKLVSAMPSDHPSVLVLAMDGDEPQVTLRLTHGYGRQEARLPRPIALGSLITFQGVGISFTQEPFMLTLEVDTDEHPLDR